MLEESLYPLHFAAVTVVVPADWKDSSCGVNIRSPGPATPFSPADIVIDKPSPVGGFGLFTQQSGGCGVHGDYISVPHTFIAGQNISAGKGRQFVHEWAKFRFGIYDETGFKGDTLYPNYFVENGQALPTLTHNGVLTGSWLNEGVACSPMVDPDCEFVADPDSEVTCSLGQSVNLDNTLRYCNATEHRVLPTKHSVLCHGKSALEIIKSHPDFQNLQQESQPTAVKPEIRIVREPATRYVLAIDTSASMADHWRWIHKAAHKFIRYDLPVNANLAVLTFNAAAKVEHQAVQVTSDTIRARLADTVPVKYHLSQKSGSCVKCALDTVYKTVSEDRLAGTHIILLTSTGVGYLTEQEQQEMKNLVGSNNAKLSSIIVPARGGANNSPLYDEISTMTEGLSYQLTDTGHSMDLLFQLNEAFAAILAADSITPTESPELVHRAEYYSGDDAVSHGQFVIDPLLGRDTLFGIYVKDEEDHLIRSVQFTDSRDNVYGPFTKMSSTFDLVNLKTINYVGQMPPFGDVSIFCGFSFLSFFPDFTRFLFYPF